MNTSRAYILLLLVISLSFSSCIAFLGVGIGKKTQKIVVHNPNEKAVVTYKNDTISKPKVRVNKMKVFNEFCLSQPGYLDQNYTFCLNKRPKWIKGFIFYSALSFGGYQLWAAKSANMIGVESIPIGLGIIYLLDLRAARIHYFDKEHTLPVLTKIDTHQVSEKYLDIVIDSNFLGHLKMKHGLVRKLSDTVVKKKLLDNVVKQYDSVYFVKAMEAMDIPEVLHKFKYFDDQYHLIKNIEKKLTMKPIIRSVEFKTVKPRIGYDNDEYTTQMNYATNITTQITWQIMDFDGLVVDSVCTRTISDYRLFRFATLNDLNYLCKNTLELSFISLQKTLRERKILYLDTVVKEISTISLEKPTPIANNINEYYKGTVAVSVDDGHGSGIIVSKDGYIVSNWHLITGKKEIDIILHDGSKFKAKVIKKAFKEDLVLLKIDTTGLQPLQLSDENEPELGSDIWAIGTPNSLSLGQSASKGIVSGLRKYESNLYLQVDASLSGGNSGGPIINKTGIVIGIVNKKLIGTGVEGIGLALSSKHIFPALGLKYK